MLELKKRFRRGSLPLLAACLATGAAAAAPLPPRPADDLVAAVADPRLRDLLDEVLERNPEIARMRAKAAAAATRAPQVRSLPDPMATLNLFVLPPETRVGPQRVGVSVSQRVPWLGKLRLGEQAAVYEAAAAEAEVEAVRLRLVTAVRSRFHELAFQTAWAALLREEQELLNQHEEISRARYAAGQGLQQGVIKVQAEITRTETRELEVESRRRSLLAELNALRDRPADREIEVSALPPPEAPRLDLAVLREQAGRRRPELAGVRAEIARAEVLVELARLAFKPDLTVGLGYTLVERRQDAAGRLDPPSGNGDDILALSVGANLPVRKRRLEAGVEEALHTRAVAEGSLRQLAAEIESTVGDAAARLPLLLRQWQLFEDVLYVQAEEALRSTEAAYVTGKLNALDLVDAEHVLFDVRTSSARAQADIAILRARLEGALGICLPALEEPES